MANIPDAPTFLLDKNRKAVGGADVSRVNLVPVNKTPPKQNKVGNYDGPNVTFLCIHILYILFIQKTCTVQSSRQSM